MPAICFVEEQSHTASGMTKAEDHIDFEPGHFPPQSVTEVIRGLAWVATDMLTVEECNDWIRIGEEFGLEESEYTFRKSKRTRNFRNQLMSDLVTTRLPAGLINIIESTGMGTEVRGLHPNWRIIRYDEGDQFPAHQDQQDELAIPLQGGTKERLRSTHTILISLSGSSACIGGATRFFPSGRCDHTVDVRLPQGAALIFQQSNLLHSGMPVLAGAKHAAQVGLLRALPSVGKVERPHIFKFGWSLRKLGLEAQIAELLRRQGQLYTKHHCNPQDKPR